MNPICKQCGKREVEEARVIYATPVCFACLPPPAQLPVAILRSERDEWKAMVDSWRVPYLKWQDWAKDLLDTLGRQPLHGSHGDDSAREVIATLAGMAPGVPRCADCGCFSTVHEVDDEELRGCTDCACRQFEAPNV